jgi:hypothetical protein
VIKLPVDIPDLVWLCRMCEKMAAAHALGHISCSALNCGGPLGGNSFPEYTGPLASVVCNYCYSCGDPAQAVMSLDRGGKIGVCRNCLQNRLKVDIPNNQEKK